MKRTRGPLVLAAFCAAVAVGARGAPSAQAESLAQTRERVAATRRAADAAAARYGAAQASYAQLGDETAAIERDVAAAEGRMAILRGVAARRAVLEYKGRASQIAAGILGGDPLVTGRRAQILAAIAGQSADTIDALHATTAWLRERAAALGARRAEQRVVLAGLQGDERELRARLAAAISAERSLEGMLNQRNATRQPAMRTGRSAATGPFVCPIQGPMAYSDDFGQPRPGGRVHEGNDLFSPRGTPNVAVVSGSVSHLGGGRGGNGIWLRGDDGNVYYYAHLDQYVGPERRVAQGEEIGTTGNTGDARNAPTHTHFEIHPRGGAAVDPYPTLRAHC